MMEYNSHDVETNYKEILILSATTDITTFHVVKWLEYFGHNATILTENDNVNYCHLENNRIIIGGDGFILDFDNIKSYWYRRNGFNFNISLTDNASIDNIFKDEIFTINEYIHYKLSQIPSLGSFHLRDFNRLIAIDIASSLFRVPNYIITNKKSDLLAFYNCYKRVVTKAIRNTLSTVEDEFGFIAYTSIISKDNINEIPEQFFPSLFLEYIEKRIEIRVFYLDGKCFSMAILSQCDETTSVDYRNYNVLNPNRNVPIILPKHIEISIDKLMRNLNLQTGSIDFILSSNEEFVFLEVNPIGQFLNVSHICNYCIEKEIAKYLISIAR